MLRLLLADLEEQAIKLSQDVAPRSLVVGASMRRTDDETGAGSRIENAMSHAVLPPSQADDAGQASNWLSHESRSEPANERSGGEWGSAAADFLFRTYVATLALARFSALISAGW